MTMHDDDNQLAAFDLSAWDVPPPAPGLVDAVIERARQAAPVAALDSGERIATPVHGKRRWWIAAAVAAVAIVAVLVGVWGVQRTPKDDHGEVSATTARTLKIGPTTAALDPGTQVRWRRDKRTISVVQPRGAGLWHVATDDTLVIDAGAMGATVEASGASLRVEVEMMNASDVRAVGVSAATAIAVALVTIVVYEGNVRARHDGQTVNVVAGAQYQIRPPHMQAPERVAVGGGPVDPRVRELEDDVKRLEAERDELLTQIPAKTTQACDEVSCVLNNYDGACCQRLKAQAPPTPVAPACDADALRKKGDTQVSAGLVAAGLDAYERSFRCRADDNLYPRMVLAACRSKNGGKADLYFAKLTPSDKPILAEKCADAGMKVGETCDADALRQKGDDHLATGMDAAALAAFEKAQKCRPDAALFRKLYIASCRSKNAAKAKLYFTKLPPADLPSLAQICNRLGIPVGTPAPAGCDAVELREKGDDHLATGQDAAALAAFDASYACHADSAVVRKAFMAACRAKNERKAKQYYALLPTGSRPTLAQICIRHGIQLPSP